MFSNDFYNTNLKSLDRNNDAGKLLKLAKQYTPKLTKGMGDDTFAPNDNATRAQAVSIIKRIL